VVGLFLVLFFVSGILHATPIPNQSTARLQNAKYRSGFLVLSKGKPVLRSAVSTVQPLATTAAQQPSSGCLFASNCANPVHITEPQALAVVGAGLLSLAGVIRRRLAR
jgi:hypothetical protein